MMINKKRTRRMSAAMARIATTRVGYLFLLIVLILEVRLQCLAETENQNQHQHSREGDQSLQATSFNHKLAEIGVKANAPSGVRIISKSEGLENVSEEPQMELEDQLEIKPAKSSGFASLAKRKLFKTPPFFLWTSNFPINSAQFSSNGHQQEKLQSAASSSNHDEPANNEKPFASMLNSAVINGKVSLLCDISPANSDDSVALILWYKDDSLAPIYTIDARKANSLDKAKISYDEAYANRATFQMKSKPALLQLESIRQEDEGEYRCRVDFKRGRTVNTIIGLRVIELPEEIRIVEPERPHKKLEGLIGPYNEGSELTLVCLTVGGKPRPQISWRRDYNVIDETYQHVDKEGTSNELRIPSLNKNHLLSIFTCQASNNNLTSPMQSSITLDLNLKPQEVSLRQIVQEPLIVGKTATFECLTHGSRPQATIHWIFQGIRHDPPMNVDQQQTSSRLTLTLQRSFNQQTLTCVAENPRIALASPLRQTIKLDVHYPPQLSIKLEPATSSGQNQAQEQPSGAQSANSAPEMTNLQEGNDIYLTCQADANPRPQKPILWRFNGRPLHLNSNMTVMNNQSLVLRKVSRQQSGLYTCESSNIHGSSASKALELIIRHAPVCATDDIFLFEAVLGQTISIDCNVFANPSKSVHYSWFAAQGERNLSSWLQRDAGQDEQIDESSSRLKWKIKEENSFAYIKCKAKNEIGLQQKPCLFQIIPAKQPQLKHTCNLKQANSNSFQIACQLNEHLKSEDFELVQAQPGAAAAAAANVKGKTFGGPPSGMSGWLNLEAIRQQAGEQLNSQASSNYNAINGEPTLRLVFPPNWLLAELYESSSDSSPQHDLIAYVIVSPNQQQLAHIKSIVEESRLFSSNPKSVYYVAARSSNTSNVMSNPEGAANSTLQDELAKLLPTNNVKLEDPSIQLADAFTFTVPSLEPEHRYKLLIYGQNLANKTRDWLVVKGETLNGQQAYLSSKSGQSSASSSSSMTVEGANLINAPAPPPDNAHDLHLLNNSALQQKSIVMRSDADNASNSNTLDHPDQSASQSDNQSRLAATSGPIDKLTASSNSLSSLMELRVAQLSHYKEYALSYAKQRPLLAIPMFISAFIVLLLVLIWSSSLLISLARGRRQNSSANSSRRRPGSGAGAEKALNGKSKPDLSRLDCPKQDKFNSSSSPNGSYSSSSSPQESATANSSSSHANQNSIVPLMANQQRQAVYAIADGPMVLNCPVNFIADVANGGCALQEHRLNYTGSLDRRELMQQQPIYLTEAGSFVQVEQQNAFNSIDRKSFCKQPPLLLTELAQLGENGIYLTDCPSNLMHEARIVNRNSPCYNNSSFSSTECSNSADNHSHNKQSNYHSNKLSGAQNGRARQRVAFDLSNQNKTRSKYLCPKNNDEQHLILSPVLHQIGPDALSQFISQEEPQQTQQKGSDSGGSNSGNTADSGHESPATGEMSSYTLMGGKNEFMNQMKHSNHLSRLSVSSASPVETQTRATNELSSLSLCCATRNNNPQNLLMLMELSPGSQESSATLLQSVDSYSELPPATNIHHHHHHNLQNNHQMATSFTSNNPQQ